MITKPTLLLDVQKCRSNIDTMVAVCKKHNLSFRPHFKTHQSLKIGRWFKEAGVSKITVSSLEMAEYFCEEWLDITVAFPINILEIKTIVRLSKKIQLNVLIESHQTIDYLDKHLTDSIGFFIKVNIGNERTGLSTEDFKSIDAILSKARKSKNLNFIGFLGHAGQTYKCRSIKEVINTHFEAKERLTALKSKYISTFPDLIISYGDTPSCSIANDFSGIDEIRPGNFVFYDIMQEQIGSCTFNDIAVTMACPIVAKHKSRSELVIYGGGIHFSKDRITNNSNKTSFGQVVSPSNSGWTTIKQNTYLRGLSQEHGIVTVPSAEVDNYKIGELLYILPVHSCMTANLMKGYRTLENQEITMFNNS